MICLACGDCCLRMSPISEGRCPYLTNEGDIYICGQYDSRPERCANHTFPARFCPVGMNKLELEEESDVIKRCNKLREFIDTRQFNVCLITEKDGEQ